MISDTEKILALVEAFEILEVHEKLTSESSAFDIVFETTLEWIEELGPDKALEKIRWNQEMLRSQIDYIATM